MARSDRIYAKNKSILSRAIPLSRPALDRLFARSDHPEQVPGKGYNIEQWRRYTDDNIAVWNRRNGSNGHQPRSSRVLLEEAQIARQKIEAQKAQFDLDVKREKYWPKVEGKSVIQRFANALWSELEKALVHELPARDDGLPAGEIARIHRDRLRDIRGSVGKILA